MADDVFETMKAACARITAGAGAGTGYLVDPNRVVTCAHVVQAVGKGGTVSVSFSGLSVDATVAECDDISDSAILTLKTAVGHITPLKLAGSVDRKSSWDGYGFPNLSKGNGVPLEGAIMDPNGKDDQGARVLLLKSDQVAAGEGAPLHGFSGSPVLVKGFVVGHLKRYIKDKDSPLRPAYGYVYATRSVDVLQLLEMSPAEQLVQAAPPFFPASDLEHVKDGRFDVFISYRSTDRAWADALFNRLEGAGFKVFIDQRELLPGEPLANALQAALALSKSAVVLISKGWLESKWCQEEGNVLLHQAIEDPSFRVVPVRLDGCKLPPIWDARMWLDFANTPAPEGLEFMRLQFALLGKTPKDAVDTRVFQQETEAIDKLLVDVRAATESTDELIADVKAAASASAQRVFDLWQKWHDADMPDGPANLAVAQTLIALGRPEWALKIVAYAKAGIRANQLKALALAKVGRLDEAIELLHRQYDKQKIETDSETGGILAGRYKQRWIKSDCTNQGDLLAAYEIYRETFERTKVSYPGINAAALALELGYRAESMRIVHKIVARLEAVEVDQLDHWGLATLGEAYLLLGDLETARKWYGKAVAHSPMRHQDIAVMRRQARRNLFNLGLQRDALDQVLYIPRVAAFSGHMVDAPGRQPSRFPPEKVPAVRAAIAERLKKYGIGYGFCSAARGSDLLFVEELKKRRGSVQILLPFTRSDFARTSVGYGWDAVFDKALEGVEVVELAIEIPAEDKQPDAYADCNRKIFEAALRKAELLDQDPILITVWNGNPGDGAGGTADAVREWRNAGHQVDVIDISKL